MAKLKTSRVSRLMRLGKGLAKAGTNYILNKNERLKAVLDLIDTMGELKGGLMKIGQMISITEDMVLPPEISKAFKKLQTTSPPMEDEVIDQVFQKNFSKTPEEIFKTFEREPIASASIGQVHLATLPTGEKVAVKIQYPGIAKAIKGDLKNLDPLEKVFRLIFPGKPDIRPMLEEAKKSLIKECDYTVEAKQLEIFKDLYCEEFPHIQIPRVFQDYSNKYVLTTQFLPGDSFEDTLNYTQEQRDFLGTQLFSSFLYSFFTQRRLHTDPQNGNYLFSPEGFTLLDFGSTKLFPKHFVDMYALLCLSVLKESKELFHYVCIELKLLHENDSDEVIQKYYDLIGSIYKPFTKPGTYSVEKFNPFQMILNFVGEILTHKKDPQSPVSEFLLLDRANAGLFTKLTQWGSRIHWQKYYQKYQEPVMKKALEEVCQKTGKFKELLGE